MTKRVKYGINGDVTYLVLSETETDYELEIIGHVWKTNEWIECDHSDLELPTATQELFNLSKTD